MLRHVMDRNTAASVVRRAAFCQSSVERDIAHEEAPAIKSRHRHNARRARLARRP